MSTEEFLEDARSFYYDLALSGNKHTLGLLLGFARRDRVLFGTDFPYAPLKAIETNTRGLEGYELELGWRHAIARENALALFPRLATAGSDGEAGALFPRLATAGSDGEAGRGGMMEWGFEKAKQGLDVDGNDMAVAVMG